MWFPNCYSAQSRRVAQIWHNLLFNAVNEKPNVQCCTVLYCIAEHKTLPVIARRKEALTCNGWTPDPPPQAQTVFSVQNLAPPSGVESACNPPALRFLSLASFRSIIVAQAFIQSHPHLHHPSCPFIVAFISFQRCQNPQIIL
jgi:hypothetical protein